jgi:hypothetical protein
MYEPSGSQTPRWETDGPHYTTAISSLDSRASEHKALMWWYKYTGRFVIHPVPNQINRNVLKWIIQTKNIYRHVSNNIISGRDRNTHCSRSKVSQYKLLPLDIEIPTPIAARIWRVLSKYNTIHYNSYINTTCSTTPIHVLRTQYYLQLLHHAQSPAELTTDR